MIQPMNMHTHIARRVAAAQQLWRYTVQTMIAPWPLFGGLLAALGIIAGLVPIAQIAIIAQMVDQMAALAPLDQADISALLPLVAALIGLRFLSALLSTQTFQRYVAAQMNERVQERIYQSFLGKALESRLEVFESAGYYDTLQLARRTLQPNRITDELVNTQLLIALLCGSAGVFIALARVQWMLPVIILLGTLLVNTLWLRLTWNVVHLNETLNSLYRRASYLRNLTSRRDSVAEVRLFDLGRHLIAGWRDQMDRLNRLIASVRGQVLLRQFPPSIVENAIYAAVVLFLVSASSGRVLSEGVFVALLYALLQMRANLSTTRLLLSRSQQFYADLRHGRAFMALPGGERQGGQAVASELRDGIRFERVTFQYPGAEQPALIDFDLHIRPGERIAIVGENGAGKSTLAKLLLGLYQPTSGRILVDGVDLAAIDPQVWRAQVGAVMQDFVRYALTARENIAVGRIERLEDQRALAEAAALSGAAEVMQALPQSYETLLGKEFEGGQDLSLGQWQKLALARAYLRDAPTLVLDEPAAALDAITEQQIYRQFLALAQSKTVLLISHRVGSARLADRIIVVQHGRLAQQGTHDELVLRAGPYAELYQLQAAWYQEEGVSHAA